MAIQVALAEVADLVIVASLAAACLAASCLAAASLVRRSRSLAGQSRVEAGHREEAGRLEEAAVQHPFE